MSPVTHGPLFDLRRSEGGQVPALRLVQSPNSVRILALVLLGLLLAGILGLIVTPWQQSVVGHGRVVAFGATDRQQKLEAPVDGRVSRVLVIEGQRVARDEVVVELADVDAQFLVRLEGEQSLVRMRRDAAEGRASQVRERVAALVQAREMALAAADARVQMARDRVAQNDQALVAADAAVAAAELNLPRVKDLAAQGIRSTRDAELAELDLKRARADADRLRASGEAARAEVESLLADRRRIEQDTSAGLSDARAAEQSARAELASASAEVLRMETRLARQQTQAVTLFRDARVFRVLVQEGQLVKQGDPLLELVPDTSSRAVEMWIDGNDAPLVSIGRDVRLQFEGWPALQFVGWPQAARGTFAGKVTTIDSHDDGSGRFRMLVTPGVEEPWPTSDVLRQGVRANGWVLLEQVPLGWELWRRLNAFPPTVTKPSSAYGAPSSPKPVESKEKTK